MIFGNLLTFLIAYVALTKGYHYLDCVEHLPNGWRYEGILEERPEYTCYERCTLKKFKYFALGELLSECYCGDELPMEDSSNDSHTHDHNDYNHNYNNDDDNDEYYYKEKEVYGRSSPSSYSLYLLSGSDRTIYRRDDQTTVITTPPSTVIIASTVATTQSALASTASGTPTQASVVSSTITNANHETSVIYQTSIRTQSGSTVIHTVTQSATPSPTSEDKNSKNQHHANIGAIVGGVVGGVGGAAVAVILILLIIRHFNKRHEQERMEQEYQEAIKPVDYIGYGKYGGSNGLLASDISGDKSQQGADTSIISRGLSSGSFDDDLGEGSIPVISNPFDDPRGISSPLPVTHKILQVANPDEDDKQ